MIYVRTFFVTVGAVLGLIAAINFAVDLDGTYRGGFSLEKRIAGILATGRAVDVVSDFNHHFMQKHLVTTAGLDPDLIVLGSSRSLLVDADLFPGRRLFVHAIPLARIEDYIALYGLHSDRPRRPRTVVVAADPWIFLPKKNYGAECDLLAEEFSRGARQIPEYGHGPTCSIARKWGILISIPRLHETVVKFAHRAWSGDRSKCREIRVADGSRSDCGVRRPDGTYAYPTAFASRSPETVADFARLVASRRGTIQGFEEDYRHIDPVRVGEFQGFLSYLRRAGADVVVVLAPYNPVYVENVETRPAWLWVMKADAAIRKASVDAGVPLVGSFNPGKTRCDSADFVDTHHPRTSCYAKLFQQLPPAMLGRR